MDRFSPAIEAISRRWTRPPRNPQIAVLLCIDARSPLHEDAPAYPRLLSVLQQARRARGRAGEEPPAVRTSGGPEAVPAGRPRGRRGPPPPAPRGGGSAAKETSPPSPPGESKKPPPAPPPRRRERHS